MDVKPHIKSEPEWLEDTSQLITEGDVDQVDVVKVEDIKIEHGFTELIAPKLVEGTSDVKNKRDIIKDVKEEIYVEDGNNNNDGSSLDNTADTNHKGTTKRKLNSSSSDSDAYSPTSHNGKRKVSCSSCGMKFGTAWILKVHMKVHTGQKPYSCPVCGRSFAQSGVLKRHLRTHTNERPFTCNDCDRTFAQMGSLRTHIKMVHTSGKHYCKICGKTFCELSAYNQHYKLNHTGGGPIICTVCGRMASNLLQHMRRHDPQKVK